MSRQVQVNYEGLSIEIQAKCDIAVHSLCKIDKTLNRIHEKASKLINKDVTSYEKYLVNSKNKIENKIEKFKKSLEEYKEKKSITMDDMSLEYKEFINLQNMLKEQLDDLTNIANELTGAKLETINEMINQGLLDLGDKLMLQAKGIIFSDPEIMKRINEIPDVDLRELTYQEMLKKENEGLPFEKLKILGEKSLDALLNKGKERVINSYKEELKEQGIDQTVLDNAKTIDEANEITNKAIADEKIRKETLKVIIKAIKNQGFIVDTKHNLKIDKEKNVVKLVALKASGQKAEFEINLDGKFMYHFDNYEGHACKKDIEPFLEDLHNIYDINILHEEVVWENPDKIQTQKYKYVNKNKGTN